MKRDNHKKPLYRKKNTKARGVWHNFGGDFKHVRHSRQEKREQSLGSMHGKQKRGLDYTPLYRFLLSKVGGNWDDIYSEVVPRLDKIDPIFWMVALHENDKKKYISVGESSYFSGLYVDSEGSLQLVNPDLTAEDIGLFCNCCTHTLNGKRFDEE